MFGLALIVEPPIPGDKRENRCLSPVGKASSTCRRPPNGGSRGTVRAQRVRELHAPGVIVRSHERATAVVRSCTWVAHAASV